MSGLITMPRMGETMEAGRVGTWLKKPGDTFQRGETLLEIETDKVTVDMPALDAGRLTEILAPEGTEVAVGAPLGRYAAAGSAGSETATPAAPEAAAPPAASRGDLADVLLPRMGETMEEGRLAVWLKKPGEPFKRGEALAEIETDKVTVEMPALADGALVEILAEPGASVAVGMPIARYRPAGAVPVARESTAKDDATAPPPVSPAAQPAPTAPPSVPARAAPGASTRAVSASAAARPRATPLARRLARDAGLDLAALTGTGRRGRIEKRDIEAAAPTAGPAVAATPPSSLPELRFATLPQGRVAYRAWEPSGGAARRTVLLLHGYSADSATWAGSASGLARGGTRVVAPDLPGHGATAIEAENFETVCEAVAGFTASLDLTRADVFGHSMGGAVAARLAASGRLAPARLTLVSPAGLGGEIDADFVRGMAAVRTGGALAHLLRRLARRPPALSRPQLDAMAQTLGAGRLANLAAALVRDGRQAIDVVPDLAALSCSVRLVWGLDDRIIPWTQVAAAPSRVAVHLIADAGHMPHWDRPQDLAALLA